MVSSRHARARLVAELPDGPGRTWFEALLVGYYDGPRLLFVGKVKNGFEPRTRQELAERFAGLETDTCPFANLPEPKNARRGEALTAGTMRKCRWLKPRLGGPIRSS